MFFNLSLVLMVVAVHTVDPVNFAPCRDLKRASLAKYTFHLLQLSKQSYRNGF